MAAQSNPGWKVDFYEKEDHVTPVQDWIEHVHSSSCPCNPLAEPWEGKIIYVHHSADSREYFEPEFRPEMAPRKN
jgi:hypothetical protein